jgi:S-DNA-T family DNA segregation ATPase FtsK/SpoIIIE
LASWKNELNAQNNKGAGNDDISEDPLYDQAVNFVYEHEKASISMIQRQLRIGFNRAARFVEQMEKDGIIGPQEGSKPRRIIKT